MTANRRLDFRVLGSFEVEVDGRVVDLGGRKPSEVLALLLIHAGEVVSTERLVDELWRDEPPRTARKTLQAHVSRLRRSLGEHILETRPLGYELRADAGHVDANVFEMHLEEARAQLAADECAQSAQGLREALALWRGRAFAGIEDVPSVALAASRLDDLRVAAVELRIDADLGLHRHASLIGELEALVAAHPFREGFRRQLMLALYRSGRQAEALAAYRAARQTFVEELGVEPGPELRALETAILRHDSALDPPSAPRSPIRRRRRRTLVIAGAVLTVLTALAVVTAAFSWPNAHSSPPRVVANSVVRIDPATNNVTAVTKVGREPDRIAYGAGSLWVVNWRDRTVSRIHPSGEVDTVGGIRVADQLVVDHDSVWVSGFESPTVSRFDAQTGDFLEAIRLRSKRAEGLAVGAGYLWITNPAQNRAQGRETVSALNLRSRRVEFTVPVGATPIFTTFGNGSVFVANYDDHTVSVLSPGSPRTATIDACFGPLGIATGYGSVWVVCYWSREVVRIDPDLRRVVARIPVGAGPLSVTTGAGGVWVTNRESLNIMRIDPKTNKVVATIPFEAPLAPHGITTGGGAVWATVRG